MSVKSLLFSSLLVVLAPMPALSWSVQKGPVSYPSVKPNTGVSNGHFYIRDGKFSLMPAQEPGYAWMIFYPGFKNYRLLGQAPFLESMTIVSPREAVFGGETTANVWYNGGQWMHNVFRQNGQNLIAFVHAEYHGYPNVIGRADKAWKSIAVTYSSDNGKTWVPSKQILTSDKPVPNPVDWGGLGDAGVAYDTKNARWIAYYSVYKMSAAISKDPQAAPGTWYKYWNGQFPMTAEFRGLGGKQDRIGSWLPGLDAVPGETPAVHWNTYLNRWVMAYNSFADHSVYLSVSKDENGVAWDKPILLAARKPRDGWRAWYPTIIGDSGDKIVGQKATLYYIDIDTKATDFKKSRFVVKIPLTFYK